MSKRSQKLKAIGWSMAFFVSLAMWIGIMKLLTGCTAPTSFQDRLEAAAAARSPMGIATRVTALLGQDEPGARINPWMLARVVPTQLYSCGNVSRPGLWIGKPSIGKRLAISYLPSGFVPRVNNDYDFPWTWPIISFNEPMATPIVLPNGGCKLWLLPETSMVWSFHGRDGYSDAVMHRVDNGQEVLFSIDIPDDTRLLGLKAWTQMVQIVEDNLITSGVYWLEVGY